MNNTQAFEAWLLTAKKKNGTYYTEKTQRSYFTAISKAQDHFPLGQLNADILKGIKDSDYYLHLDKSRRGDLNSALELYKEFLHDRQNGWRTIEEFSEGKQFAETNEFSLHVTYDKPFTVKELSEFLKGLDFAFKGMLVEQGFSREKALQTDMTIVKVSEGSLWFEIFSAVAMVAMPIVELVIKRYLQKCDKKDCNCDVAEKK